MVGTQSQWTGHEARQLRTALRLSVRAFAAHLGIAERTVSKWEKAGQDITPWPDNQALLDTCLAHAPDDAQARFTQLVNDDNHSSVAHAEAGRQLLTRDLPPSDAVVAASQEAWCAVRSHLIRHRTQLAKQAVRLYDPAWQLTHTPALALPSWLPSRPVPIDAVTLEWVPHPPRPAITGHEAELRPMLPLRSPGHAFRQYTSAIRYLSPPSLFENRPSYRLLNVSWEPSGRGKLQFGLATFFDKLDVSEALGHEFAAAMMEGVSPTWPQLPFRARLSQPFDLSSRMGCAGIATLTVRRNTTDGLHTFFLLSRDPAKVVANGGHYGVIPAGEFQPSCIAPACMLDDLDLWRNIVREYSEELLGEPEHDGSSGQPLDYECWPFYHALQGAREAGQLRAHVLGVVLHALGLNPAIMTAVVIDDVVFDDLFRDLVTVNAEGRVITSLDNDQSVYGLPFTEAIVRQFLDREPLGGTSAACLALAWRHRESLLNVG